MSNHDPARWDWLTNVIAIIFLVVFVPFVLPVAVFEWVKEVAAAKLKKRKGASRK